MSKMLKSLFLCWCFASSASVVYALGGDHTGPVSGSNIEKWPAGLKELANSPLRVHGYFVNWEDIFFYAGDVKALNGFLKEYGKLADTRLEVVLHPGKKKASSPWDKQPRDLEVDWKLYTTPFSADQIKNDKIEPGPFVTRVDLWLGGQIELEKLEVPQNVEVKSGGEIEQFIARHEKERDSDKEADRNSE